MAACRVQMHGHRVRLGGGGGPRRLVRPHASFASTTGNPHRPCIRPVALDVEFSMIRCKDGCVISPAAQVCLVDDVGNVLLKTFCRNESALAEAKKSIGGVPLADIFKAPTLDKVCSQLLELCDGKLLVGHGLVKDVKMLESTDLQAHPMQFCTMTFPEFQGSGGTSRSLRFLASKFLSVEIQKQGERHDAEEDAQAVMQLYMRHVRPKMLDYDDLVEHYAQQMLRLRPDQTAQDSIVV